MSSKLSLLATQRIQPALVQLDFSELVNDVANRLEKTMLGYIRVLPSARNVLIKSMAPHDDHLQRDLLSGKMTEVQLRSILFGIFNAAANAKATRSRRPRVGFRYHRKTKSGFVKRIDGRGLRAAMKLKCRYLGLC